MQPADFQAYLQAVEQLPNCIRCGQKVHSTTELRYQTVTTGSRKVRRAKKLHVLVARCEDCWVEDQVRYHGNSQTANLINDTSIT